MYKWKHSREEDSAYVRVVPKDNGGLSQLSFLSSLLSLHGFETKTKAGGLQKRTFLNSSTPETCIHRVFNLLWLQK
jgi:hypothetical protein